MSARWLRRAGFNQPVVCCSDGLQAVRYFSAIEPQAAPHIILLDLHMPLMNGLEVLHWIRENYSPRDVAVCLLTSSEDPEHTKLAATDGINDYLLKSPQGDKLIESLDCLIAMKNAECLGVGERREGHFEPGTEGLASFGKATSFDTAAVPRDIFNKELEQ